jgi:capsular exopolysaccharide synthesis family protein
MAQYDVDLRDYWRVIKKKKAIIILIVFLVGACSYGFAKLKEPEPLYESSSAIKIERITSMADFLMGGFWRQEESLITHAYIIKSFPVLEQTAKELQWLPGNLTTQEIRNSKTYLSAIQRLKSLITAEQEGGTNIINIKVVSNSPDESAHVANAVAQAYRNYNIQEKNKKTFETKAFIEEQLQLNSDQLKQAEEALQAFKEGYALISMDDQARNILDQLFNVEAEYEQVIKEKNQIVSQLRVLRENPDISSKEFDRTLFSPIKKESPIYGLRVKLSELLLKRQTLLVDFTEKHPEVVEVDDQIQAVTDEIKKELSAFFATLKMREASLSKKVSRLRQESQGLPEKALQLVRLQREVASQEALYSQLKAKYQETLIQESGKVEEVTIVKPALVPSSPFNIPSKIMIVVTGFIMGLVIGIVVAFIVEVFDTSMGTIEDVENLLQVPVLGVIPLLAKEEKDYTGKEGIEKVRERDLVTHYDPKSLSAEAFRTLRSNLQFMSPDKKGKSFLITSSFVKEGKTFSVINLSLSIAQAGSKVLLLEADLRKPVIHKTFGLEKMPGLTDCVLGNYQWDEVKNSITDIMLGDFELEEVLQTPGLDNLTIVTAGTQPTNPAEILRSTRFREFLQEAYEKYDMIFLDSPPVLPVADAAELAPLVDGVILVYTVGRIGRGILKRAKMTLDNINATVWGVILNNVRPEMGPDYFKYHTQYYYDSERDDAHKKRSSIKNFFKKYL